LFDLHYADSTLSVYHDSTSKVESSLALKRAKLILLRAVKNILLDARRWHSGPRFIADGREHIACQSERIL